MLYFDEVILTNPLGHTAKAHKYGMIYFTLADLPLHLRCHLDFIFLVGVARAEIMSSDTIDDILKFIVNDLNELAQYKLYDTARGKVNISCNLSLIVGDTPAINRLLGLKEGVGFSFMKCRHCFANKEDFDIYFDLELFKKRNVSEHNVLCAQLLYSKTQSSSAEYSKETGINRYSALFQINDMCTFDPFLQSPHDLMHILFEGIIPHTLREFFTTSLSNRELSKTQLNSLQDLLNNFRFHALDRSDSPKYLKISSFTDTNAHINLTAASTWTFLRCFPIIASSLNLNSLSTWPVIEILLRLTSNLVSRKFTDKSIVICKSLAIQYVTLYKNLFPSSSFIPKMHYLLHIVDSIPHLGPPISYWTMRFEGKHKYFKSVTLHSNFRNILSDIAFNHSLQISFISSHKNLEEQPSYRNFSKQPHIIECSLCSNNTNVGSISSYKSKFFTYYYNSILVLGCNPGIFPIFGLIDKICMCSIHNTPLFSLKVYLTESFEKCYNSFICLPIQHDSFVITLESLSYIEPLAFYKFSESCPKIIIPIKRNFESEFQ